MCRGQHALRRINKNPAGRAYRRADLVVPDSERATAGTSDRHGGSRIQCNVRSGPRTAKSRAFGGNRRLWGEVNAHIDLSDFGYIYAPFVFFFSLNPHHGPSLIPLRIGAFCSCEEKTFFNYREEAQCYFYLCEFDGMILQLYQRRVTHMPCFFLYL